MGNHSSSTQAMSKKQFLSFLEAVNTDSALQEKLKDAAEPDAVAAIAQSAGFESVSPELVTDFLEYVAAQSTIQQEGDQELSAVSGGLSPLAIAGIASGAVAGAALVGMAAYYTFKGSSGGIDAARVSSVSSVSSVTTEILESSESSYEGSEYYEEGWGGTRLSRRFNPLH